MVYTLAPMSVPLPLMYHGLRLAGDNYCATTQRSRCCVAIRWFRPALLEAGPPQTQLLYQSKRYLGVATEISSLRCVDPKECENPLAQYNTTRLERFSL